MAGKTVSEHGVRIEDDGVLHPEASQDFVSTPYVESVTERALMYLESGYAIHFAGPAGTGKTTLAFHVAAKLGRPMTLIHGDDEFASSDLIGREGGYRKYKLVDNFIHSVLKTEEEVSTLWVDNRLSMACQHGYTLIYDEFSRSRPEANNSLLSILSHGILNLPKGRASGEGYLPVHPGFRAIFTSNPEEYAGTHKTQDALMDRLITMRLGHYDRETEVRVTMSKSGIGRPDAERIVDLIRAMRGQNGDANRPTVRACISIARVLARYGGHARADDKRFRAVVLDVLGSDARRSATDPGHLAKLDETIQELCPRRKAR